MAWIRRWPCAAIPPQLLLRRKRSTAALHGLPGVLALADRHELVAAINARLDQLDVTPTESSEALTDAQGLDADALERAGAASIRLRDVLWAIRRDRFRTARAVDDLAGRSASVSARAGYLSIQQALSAIDRMEVRGRDSAGLHVFVWNHSLDVTDPSIAAAIAGRTPDPLFQAGSVRVLPDCRDRPRALVRLQGGRRDRRARRQHCGDARPDRRRRSPASGDVGRDR